MAQTATETKDDSGENKQPISIIDDYTDRIFELKKELKDAHTRIKGLQKALLGISENAECAGIQEGTLEEAKESIKRRFTAREIDAILSFMWFSDMMQSIRNQIAGLKERVNAIEVKP